MQGYFLKQDNKRNGKIITHFLSPYLYLSRPEISPPPLAIILSKQHKEKEKEKVQEQETFPSFVLLSSRPSHLCTLPNIKNSSKRDQEQEDSKKKRRIIKKKEEEGRREAKQAIQPSTSSSTSSLTRAYLPF